jgi:tetratricopeptide (TPR) repeat protein
LTLLEKVQKKNQNSFEVPMNIAKIHLLRKNFKAAEKQYIKALAVDERSAPAHHGLGVCFLRQGQLDMAVEEFLLALESNFYMPNVHYHLGEALYRSGDYDEAVNAFELAVRFSPGMTKARKMLKDLYQNKLNEPVKAAQQEEFLKNNIRGEVIIVTGVEGAGAEKVLDLLSSKGIEILADETEVTRESKNKYEFSKIKNLKSDNSWLRTSGGKAIMVNVQMLSFLPPEINYKVIVVNRDLKEVIMEQQRFLGKKVTPETLSLKHLAIIEKLQNQLNSWVESQPNVPVLTLSYEELVETPDEQWSAIEDFIGVTTD